MATKAIPKTAIKAIRAHCKECAGDSAYEVELCGCPQCKLWPWRFGQYPATAAKHGRLVDPDKFGEGLKCPK